MPPVTAGVTPSLAGVNHRAGAPISMITNVLQVYYKRLLMSKRRVDQYTSRTQSEGSVTVRTSLMRLVSTNAAAPRHDVVQAGDSWSTLTMHPSDEQGDNN